MTPQKNTRPKVIIVGAGIGGITLGLLLERAGIPFDIYERASTIKPLGSAIGLGCNVSAIFKQLGIWEEYQSQCKPTFSMNVSNSNRKRVCNFNFQEQGVLGMSPDRLHLGKKVVSTGQTANGVFVGLADGEICSGDILVGADGAYSLVRKQLYHRLQQQKKLPASDAAPLPFKNVALVGQTRPLDPKDFPELLRHDSPFECVMDNGRAVVIHFTTKANTICWQANRILDRVASKEARDFQNEEWGPEGVEKMCNEMKHLSVKIGRGKSTFEDLVALSPKESLSKIVLEEKIFKTWYSGRTVLLGDACHKMHPAGGMGASSAIQDAAILANWINALSDNPSISEVTKAFKAYKAERLPVVMDRQAISKFNSCVFETTWKGACARFALNHLPKWIMDRAAYRHVPCRPQVAFLPLVDDYGTIKASRQPSLEKTLPIVKRRQLEAKLSHDLRHPF
ncbi:hypothetical protein BGZ94_006468 [Podila epigama]|nr:hypothetical protein BGZ94_006468 [Podila epigama]